MASLEDFEIPTVPCGGGFEDAHNNTMGDMFFSTEHILHSSESQLRVTESKENVQPLHTLSLCDATPSVDIKTTPQQSEAKPEQNNQADQENVPTDAAKVDTVLDLSKLAMFGKEKQTMRRSQLLKLQRVADPASNQSLPAQSTSATSIHRKSSSQMTATRPVPRYRSSSASRIPTATSNESKTTCGPMPVRVPAVGPITRARSRELKQKEHDDLLDKEMAALSVEERRPRDRSKKAAPQTVKQPAGAIKITRPSSMDRHMSNIPRTQRGFDASVNRRQSSVGKGGIMASTPKENPLALPKPATPTASFGVRRPSAPSARSSFRNATASSASRSGVPPSRLTRPSDPPASRPSIPARGAPSPRNSVPVRVRPSSKVRTSVSRPSVRDSASRTSLRNSATRPSVHDSALRASQGTTPSGGRSSVIRDPSVPRAPRMGTPVRAFKSDLRSYPPPSGKTPLLKPLTKAVPFVSHYKPHTPNVPPPAQVVSASRPPRPVDIRSLVDRLSQPRRSVQQPLRVAPGKDGVQATHGVASARALRSRSNSVDRRK